MPIGERWQAIFKNVAFGIIGQHRHIPAPINARDQRPVIGEEFREKRDEE